MKLLGWIIGLLSGDIVDWSGHWSYGSWKCCGIKTIWNFSGHISTALKIIWGIPWHVCYKSCRGNCYWYDFITWAEARQHILDMFDTRTFHILKCSDYTPIYLYWQRKKKNYPSNHSNFFLLKSLIKFLFDNSYILLSEADQLDNNLWRVNRAKKKKNSYI